MGLKKALARAKEFDISVILPRYEAFYEKVVAESKLKELVQN